MLVSAATSASTDLAKLRILLRRGFLQRRHGQIDQRQPRPGRQRLRHGGQLLASAGIRVARSRPLEQLQLPGLRGLVVAAQEQRVNDRPGGKWFAGGIQQACGKSPTIWAAWSQVFRLRPADLAAPCGRRPRP